MLVARGETCCAYACACAVRGVSVGGWEEGDVELCLEASGVVVCVHLVTPGENILEGAQGGTYLGIIGGVIH